MKDPGLIGVGGGGRGVGVDALYHLLNIIGLNHYNVYAV